MAVPKKRRIGSKYLQRGAINRREASHKWMSAYAMLPRLPLACIMLETRLMGSLKRALSGAHKQSNTAVLQSYPAGRISLLKGASKTGLAANGALARATCKLSLSPLPSQRLFCRPKPMMVAPIPPKMLARWQKKPAKKIKAHVMSNPYPYLGWPYRPSATTAYVPIVSPKHFNMLQHRALLGTLYWKCFLQLFQVPHIWGSQRQILLRAWDGRPSYVKYVPLAARLDFISRFAGYRAFSANIFPANLRRPRGPTLKDLWQYAKTNPNEGYWIYCLWLQVRNKWRRWWRFPLQYLAMRNIFRRLKFERPFYANLFIHWRLRFGLHWRLRARRAIIAIFTAAFMRVPHTPFYIKVIRWLKGKHFLSLRQPYVLPVHLQANPMRAKGVVRRRYRGRRRSLAHFVIRFFRKMRRLW